MTTENGEVKPEEIPDAVAALKNVAEEVKELAKPLTRDQLEANVKVSMEWIKAIRAGTYPGSFVAEIAGLVGFLTNQHQLALADYEKESFKHPEWGGPQPCMKCKQVPGKNQVVNAAGIKELLCVTCTQRELNEQAKNAQSNTPLPAIMQ